MFKTKFDPFAHALWIRAQKPPYRWFISLRLEEQQALADVGDAYIEAFCVTIAAAAQDPEIASAVIDDPESVETILSTRAALKTQLHQAQNGSPMSLFGQKLT